MAVAVGVGLSGIGVAWPQPAVDTMVNAVTTNRKRPKHTVFVINFDEWGGFFEHVPPPTAPDVHPDFELIGFRVPAILISPFARRGHVSHQTYDHTSVLKLIEWRWGLSPLSVRDANTNNLADELDFSDSGNLSAPQFAVPEVVAGAPCLV